MLKLSIMTCTMADGEWGKDPQVRGLCELVSGLGLDGIDWITTLGHDPREITRISKDHGIHTVCYTFFSDMDKPDAAARRRSDDAAREALETARLLETDKVMVVLGGREGCDRHEARRYSIDGLSRLVPLATSAGITVTTEHFCSIWAPFSTSADMNELVAAVPGMKIAYDNGNCVIGGEDSLDAYLNSKDDIVHAHFKDWVRADSGRASLDGKFYQPALMGEGIVDHRACLAAMVEAGYDGYINFEYEGRKYDRPEAARRGVAYLRGVYETVAGERA